jgi:hypothetical protein
MALYRTFVQLDPYERWILSVFQHALSSQKKKKIPTSAVISAIVREAWDLLQAQSDPQKIEELKRSVPMPAELKMVLEGTADL